MTGETDFDIDAPRGWEHNSGYRLATDGDVIDYIAGGKFRAIAERTYNPDKGEDEFYTVVTERQSDGSETPRCYHEFHNTKRQAADRLNDAMEDLQTELAAPVEHFDNAYRQRGGSREVSAIDHNGGRYCLDCARDHEDIDVQKYVTKPVDVRSGGPVFIDSETDMAQFCGSCHRQIETHVLGHPADH